MNQEFLTFPKFLRMMGQDTLANFIDAGILADPTVSTEQEPSGKFHIGQAVKNEDGDVFLVKTNHGNGIIEVVEQPKTPQRFVFPESDLTSVVEYDNDYDDYEKNPCDDCPSRFKCTIW